MKRKISCLFISTIMAFSLVACGGGAETTTDTTTENQDTTATETETESDAAADTTTEGGKVLKIAGPGLFTTVGKDGSTDIVTGVELPGYQVVMDRWAELHPDVTLEIEPAPWDNWKPLLQTAALSGEVDVLLHGASITDIAEPVGPYLEKEEGLAESFSMLPMRRTETNGNSFDTYIPYGLTITAAPLAVLVDTQIFANYGLELPTEDWTFDDLLALAEKTTGTDPVSGAQTYGVSMIEAGSANKNYIWASRGFNAEVFDFGATLAETNADFTKDATRKTLEYLDSLEAFTSPDYIEGLDLTKAYTADNDIAMLITESLVSDYDKVDIAGIADRFVYIPLPKITEGTNAGITSSHMGDWNMAICNTSDDKDLAWEFIKFMATDEVVQQWIVDANSIPNNKNFSNLLSDRMDEGYYNAINSILVQQPLEFSASTNTCYDSANFGSFASDVTSVLNEMFVDTMDTDQAIEFVQNNLNDYMTTVQ